MHIRKTLKLAVIATMFAGFMLSGSFVYASYSDWSDDFEIYSTGNINAQGLWTTLNSSTAHIIVSSPVNGGVRAYSHAALSDVYAFKNTGYNLMDGGLHYLRFKIRHTSLSRLAYVEIRGNPSDASNDDICYVSFNVHGSGSVAVVSGATSKWGKSTTTANTWYDVQIEFDDDDE